jgi:predicted nuclease of predicted toxin-antitoxin system
MRLLLDLNLSPDLCALFAEAGHDAVHWSAVGALTARDEALMMYAHEHALVIITHDLDFGALLAASRARGPSVVQVRTQDLLSDSFVGLVSTALDRFGAELAAGALVAVDESRSRVRILPITSK